jgi:CRP-like cAMP-binding protein
MLGVRIFLRGIPLLAPLSRHMLDEVAARLHREHVPAQTVIVREGEPGDRLYIVYSGEVEVVGRDPWGHEVTIATQGKATYFGEIALLRAGPRTATVRARGPVTLYSLSRADFQELLRRAHEVRGRMTSTAADRYARYGQERLPMRL